MYLAVWLQKFDRAVMFILVTTRTVSQQERLVPNERILDPSGTEIQCGQDGGVWKTRARLRCVAAAVGRQRELRTSRPVGVGLFSAISCHEKGPEVSAQGKKWPLVLFSQVSWWICYSVLCLSLSKSFSLYLNIISFVKKIKTISLISVLLKGEALLFGVN